MVDPLQSKEQVDNSRKRACGQFQAKEQVDNSRQSIVLVDLHMGAVNRKSNVEGRPARSPAAPESGRVENREPWARPRHTSPYKLCFCKAEPRKKTLAPWAHASIRGSNETAAQIN